MKKHHSNKDRKEDEIIDKIKDDVTYNVTNNIVIRWYTLAKVSIKTKTNKKKVLYNVLNRIMIEILSLKID